MKNYRKLSGLVVISAIFMSAMSFSAAAYAAPEQRTLVDYLNDRNVTFLIVNSGQYAKLTTYGWQSASESCKTIRTAGFNVSKIKSFSSEGLIETNAICN